MAPTPANGAPSDRLCRLCLEMALADSKTRDAEICIDECGLLLTYAEQCMETFKMERNAYIYTHHLFHEGTLALHHQNIVIRSVLIYKAATTVVYIC